MDDDADAIREGIRARREQRERRRRHRVFTVVALVAAAALTVTVYATSSSGGKRKADAPVSAGSQPPTTVTTVTTVPATTVNGTFTPTPGAVQWIDAPPQSAAGPAHPAVPPGTPPCTAFQLSAKGSWQLNGSAVIGGIRFTNHSGSACSLHGVPDVLLTDHRGIRIDLPQQPSATPDAGPALLNPGTSDAASIGLQWTNVCTTVQAPFTVRVNLPDGGNVIDVDPDTPDAFAAVPPCGNPAAAATFTVDPMQAAAAPQAPPPSASLTASLRAPAATKAGDRLRYEVTLTNPTAAPIALDPCPSYTESLAGVTASYQLNCGPVGQLAPGDVAVFAMELGLPADAAVGPATLQWQAGGPAASAPVQITAA